MVCGILSSAIQKEHLATNKADKSNSSRSPRRTARLVRIGLFALLPILCIIGYGVFGRGAVEQIFSQQGGGAPGMNDTGRRIQVSVLNASGIRGSAMLMTRKLRERGYDVVEIGNYELKGSGPSFVIMWNSDTATARKLAVASGIDGTKLVRKKDPKALVDFSVVLGNDCSQLIHQ